MARLDKEKTKEYMKVYSKEYYLKNKERICARTSLWGRVNVEKKRAICEKYRKANLAKDAYNRAQARARKRKATPNWANKEEIQKFYTLANWNTKMFGFPWDVDHIIPLKGKNVCGLHIENNLR